MLPVSRCGPVALDTLEAPFTSFCSDRRPAVIHERKAGPHAIVVMLNPSQRPRRDPQQYGDNEKAEHQRSYQFEAGKI